MHHLVERGSDEAGEAEDIGFFTLDGFEYPVARHHDPDVDNLVVVAGEHDRYDVFADVVHVAFHRREQHPGCRPAVFLLSLLLLDIRDEPCYRAFHDAGALDHLGKKHLPFGKEVSDGVHAVHERALDDLKGARIELASLLGIDIDIFHNAFYERVTEPFLNGGVSPFRGFCFDFFAAFTDGFGMADQPFRRIRTTVEEHILHQFEQRGFDILINGQLAGIDDAHVESCPDGMIEECRMHGFAHRFVAPEREGDVADASRHFRIGEVLLDPPNRLDKVEGVVVVLVDAGCYGQHVRIENNVFGREADFPGENIIGATADLDAALATVGLALFVKRHDNRSGAVLQDFKRPFPERIFALLETDGVDDAFSLDALQSLFDDRPSGTVDHDRHPGDFRF